MNDLAKFGIIKKIIEEHMGKVGWMLGLPYINVQPAELMECETGLFEKVRIQIKSDYSLQIVASGGDYTAAEAMDCSNKLHKAAQLVEKIEAELRGLQK